MLKRKDASGGDPPVTQFGRYRVLSKLGHGAMATVYLAEDPSLNRMVAVKVIHSHLASIGNLLDRFTVEAKTAAALRSPNIVEIFDYGMQDGQQYLVMEYIDGPNLQFVLNLQNGKPLSAEACAVVIAQAAEGLTAAEKNSVVHRDIKPENMMFTSEGILKIADFGIAHINEQNLTQTGSILGSPSFMSPEQIEGGKPTHQTDMFSLGSVFYYCLTGRKPFSGNNIPTIMRNICDLPHPPVLELSPDADPVLTALVDTLLQKKTENRGKGSRWLNLQLRAYLNQRGVLDLHETARALLQQATPKTGDRTLVESAAPAGEAPPRPGKPAPTPLRPGAVQSRPTLAAVSEKPPTGMGRFFSPLTIGIAGVGVLALITAGIWISVFLKNPSSAPRVQAKPVAAPALQLQSLALDPAQVEIAPGQTRFLRVVAVPAEAMGETGWRSSDTLVARVKSGELLALAPGKASVEVFSASTPSIAGACEVTVSGPKPRGRPPTPKPAPAIGAILSVISAPPFAEVFLDNKYLGTTPLQKVSVAAGRHRLQVSHRDFQSLDTDLVLRGELRLKFHLLEQQE